MKTGKTLGEYIKAKRIAAGLAQKDVSDKFGYSTPQFISNWERGVSNPPIGDLKKLAAIYGIDAEELFDIILIATIKATTEDLRRKFKTSAK